MAKTQGKKPARTGANGQPMTVWQVWLRRLCFVLIAWASVVVVCGIVLAAFSLFSALPSVFGVDVGAMEYIHHRLLDLRDGGKSILLISADLDEVRSLSDRLAVIYGGRIVAEGKPDTWSDMEIGLLMTGGSLAPEKEGTA